MIRSVLSARFNMTCSVISQTNFDNPPVAGAPPLQDPDTGEFVRVWTKDTDPNTALDQKKTFKCIARGVTSAGASGQGNTEFFNADGTIKTVEFIRIQFSADVSLSRRDRITDITNRKGVVVWREEENGGAPTVFNILGITPVLDPWGNHIEYSASCQRAEVQ